MSRNRIAVLAALVVVASGLFGLGVGPAGASEVPCTSQLVPGTDGTAIDSDISSDGRWVVFTSTADLLTGQNDDGSREVFRYDRATDTTVQATDHEPPAVAGDPLVSDSGDRIAYALVDGTDEALRYVDVSIENGDDVAWAGTDAQIGAFDLSDDGSTLVWSDTNTTFDNPDATREIIGFRLEESLFTVTEGVGVDSSQPAVSPDGTVVAFASEGDFDPGVDNADGSVEVFVHDVGEGTHRQVTDTPDASFASYGPDLDAAAEQVFYTASGLQLGAGLGEMPVVADLASGALQPLAPPNLKDEQGWSAGPISGNGEYAFFESTRARLTTQSTALFPGGVQAIDDSGLIGLGLRVDGLVVLTCATFPDVGPNHPFVDDVEWMAAESVSTGDQGTGLYRPAANVSRSAMAAFLYRFSGEPSFSFPASATFPDVSTSHPFFAEVEWLVEQDITEGYGDGTFRPSAPVTRQAMSAFIYRTVGELPFVPPGEPTFSDVSTSHPFFAEVEWMAAEEISEGYEDGTFRPSAPVTRQAMAAFLHRAHPLLPT
jgi:hypothetical protein